MTLSCVLFTAFSALAVLAALGVVLLRNVVHSAVLLGFCLSMVGGLYALLGADFLFAAQILIYVGAIAVIFLFVVLLAGRRAELVQTPFNEILGAGALAGFLIFALLAGIALQVKGALNILQTSAGGATAGPTTAPIGSLLLGPYAVAMEILGLVLLVALIGATLLAKGLMEHETKTGGTYRNGANGFTPKPLKPQVKTLEAAS